MIGELGSTTDPVVLVPGSVQALRADADDLDRRASDLGLDGDDTIGRVVASWTGDTAEIWAERRHVLVESLDAVAGIYQTVAAVLRGHARLLVWAQEQAAVAVALWAQGVRLGMTLDGQLGSRPLLIAPRPQLAGPFGIDQGLPETDPGAATRRAAERVLFAARREVQVSNAAVAQVMDAFSEGLPDGQFHFDQFLAGIGDWFAGIAGLLYKFNQIRFIVDNDAFTADAHQMGEGLYGTGKYLLDNPLQAVPVLFDTRTMHDNPGRWWGRLFPDLALTVAGGVGAATKLTSGLRLGEGLTDLLATRRATFLAADPEAGMIDFAAFLRREPARLGDGSTIRALDAAEEAAATARYEGLPTSRVRAQGPEAAFQASIYGENERLITLANGREVYPDGFTPQYGAIGDAKFVDSPSSWYVPDSLSNPRIAQLAIADMDATLSRLASAAETMGGNGVVELTTNSVEAARFIEGRMQALHVPGYVRIVEGTP